MKNKLQFSAIIVVALAGSLIFIDSRSLSQTRPVAIEAAGQKFKNIKVLGDMPADQMGKVMNIMTASLGRDCKMCHVSNEGDFEKDDNEHKEIAREMIKMTEEINRRFFKGKQEVSCSTCHNGRPHPLSVPDLLAAPLPPRPAQPKDRPKVEDIIARYNVAVGSPAAMAKLGKLTFKGIRLERDGKTSEPEEVRWDHGTLTVTTTYGKYILAERFDGKTVSKTGDGSPITLHPDEVAQIERESRLFGAADLARIYTKLDLRSVDRIDGKTIYVIQATPSEGSSERLFFDATTGFLVRRIVTTPTVVGDFQFQVDYSDFKSVRGIKFPMTIRFAMPAVVWTRKISDVKVQ